MACPQGPAGSTDWLPAGLGRQHGLAACRVGRQHGLPAHRCWQEVWPAWQAARCAWPHGSNVAPLVALRGKKKINLVLQATKKNLGLLHCLSTWPAWQHVLLDHVACLVARAGSQHVLPAGRQHNWPARRAWRAARPACPQAWTGSTDALAGNTVCVGASTKHGARGRSKGEIKKTSTLKIEINLTKK